MKLLVVGTGEAFTSDLGNTSYLLQGEYPVLFDCGYQIPERLWRDQLHEDIHHRINQLSKQDKGWVSLKPGMRFELGKTD